MKILKIEQHTEKDAFYVKIDFIMFGKKYRFLGNAMDRNPYENINKEWLIKRIKQSL